MKQKKIEKKKNTMLPVREAYAVNLRAIRLLAKRFPQMMVSMLLKTIFGAVTPYVGIYLSAQIIGELSGAKDPLRLRNLVLWTLCSAAVISLIGALLDRWHKTVSAMRGYKTIHISIEKLLDMDFADVDDPEVQQKLSNVRQNQNGGGWGLNLVWGQLDSLLGAVFHMLGGLSLTVSLFSQTTAENTGMLKILDHPLCILTVVCLLFFITWLSPTLATKARSYWAINVEAHALSNRLFCHFGFIGNEEKLREDIRMYRQERIANKYNSDKTGIFGSSGTFAVYARGPMGAYSAVSAAVSNVFTGCVYLYICLKAWAGAFGVGAVTQYIASITAFSGSISTIIRQIGNMRVNATFLQANFALLDMPNRMYQGSLTVEKRSDRKYEVEFRDVSFCYPGSETPALSHVNMKFRIGQRMAVVGPNGSGKTTFIKLLCRLYDPTEGVILLNGIDIRKYNYEEYMHIFSVVFQDFYLFSLTLGQNVAADSDYDAARVAEALEMAGFGDRLKTLEHGLDTYLRKEYDTSGIDISGGEAQKVALARTLYRDAPFIILDEPTAALDPIAEAEVYESFDVIVGDKTAIYISHRLSSCRFCDEIAVFDHGTVIQKGSHDALLADAGGLYHALWHAQAQYYTNEKKNAAKKD